MNFFKKIDQHLPPLRVVVASIWNSLPVQYVVNFVAMTTAGRRAKFAVLFTLATLVLDRAFLLETMRYTQRFGHEGTVFMIVAGLFCLAVMDWVAWVVGWCVVFAFTFDDYVTNLINQQAVDYRLVHVLAGILAIYFGIVIYDWAKNYANAWRYMAYANIAASSTGHAPSNGSVHQDESSLAADVDDLLAEAFKAPPSYAEVLANAERFRATGKLAMRAYGFRIGDDKQH